MKATICARPVLQLNLLILLLIIITFSIPSLAQNRHIYDYAKIYQPELISQYDILLQEMVEKSGVRIDAAILTEFNNQRSKNEVVTYLQQQMANKKPALKHSILLIISIHDSQVFILPSQDIEKFYPDNIKFEITRKIQKDIQSGNYDQILKSGLGGIVYYYNQGINPNPETQKSTPMELIRNNLLLIVLGILIFAALRFGRRKPPRNI